MRNMKNAHKVNKSDDPLTAFARSGGRASAERRRLAFALAEQVALFLAQDAPSRGALAKAYEALVASGWKPPR